MTDAADENPKADDEEPSTAGADAATTDLLEPSEEGDGTATAEAGAIPDELGVHRTLRADVWRQFRRHKGAVFGLILLSIITLSVMVGLFIYPNDPFALNVVDANQGASWDYPAGTDNLGRDTISRAMYGGRVSLSVGFAAMFFGLVIGVTVGVLAGFIRWLDAPLMRVTDLFLSLPLLPLLLVVVIFFREPMTERFGESMGIWLLVVLVIGATSWMQTARVVRGDVLAVKEEEFVLAAQSVGTGTRRIILRHVLPNVMSSIIVSAALGVATAILTESAISFLGLGFPADFPTWGRLLSDGRNYMQINIWRTIVPGGLISLVVLSVNFIGDGLRDALDPRLRSKG